MGSPVAVVALIGALAAVGVPAPARAPVPAGVAAQLPRNYDVLAAANLSFGRPRRIFVIVALGRIGETAKRASEAPRRPLLIFERRDGRFVAIGRNDFVVMKADEGGQCDPFLDGDAIIAVKARYFTVQNGVACGGHWTDYITFRLDDGTGTFVFDNERAESWSFNTSDKPDADALVRDGAPAVVRDRPGRFTAFDAWRPKR